MEPTWLVVNNLVHTALGTLALLGGLVALFAVKGSRLHVRGGWVFVSAMALVVGTALFVTFHQLIPLSIVMSVAVFYLIPSAILSIRRHGPAFLRWHGILMAITAVLALFSLLQFVRLNFGSGQLLFGPLVLSAMFAWLFLQDWTVLRAGPDRARSLHPNLWLRRHLARMVLAFTFAVMALVRIGINFGISLEATVIVPLLIAALVIVAFYRRYPLPSSPSDRTPGQR